jgi:hypothetical protein
LVHDWCWMWHWPVTFQYLKLFCLSSICDPSDCRTRGGNIGGGQMSLICGIGDGGCTPCTLMISSKTYIFTMTLFPTSY